MKLSLPRFGIDEVEIDPASLIEFPNGLPGFEGCKHFKLFHSENNPDVFWLLSVDTTDVVFSITSPEALGVFYNMSLSEEELATLQAQEGDELQVSVLLAWGDDTHEAFQAFYESPIVINVSRQVAIQKVLHFANNFSIATYEAPGQSTSYLSALTPEQSGMDLHAVPPNVRQVELAAA